LLIVAGPLVAPAGAEVTVVQRGPELRPGGQAVDARGVAKEVIRRMGLDAAVRTACTETAGAYTVDVDGNVLETYRADDHGGDGFIAEIEILRGDLSQVLYDDTRDGLEYVFGEQIAELTQDADGVDVVFAGGGRRRFDLVIGADGLHSALAVLCPAHPDVSTAVIMSTTSATTQVNARDRHCTVQPGRR
jgi:2-polyprenyl-6-methoxyphenol hydroxylase-like FAD-dependent oxidoreductase